MMQRGLLSSVAFYAALWAICLPTSLPQAAAVSPARLTPLVRAIQKVRPAVVNIHSQKTVTPVSGSTFPERQSSQNRMSGMGTGVIVDERGYIATNYHVIEDVSTIRVTLVDGATYSAEVVARDPETDLALLKIEPFAPLPVMPMGTSDDLLYGETVIAIGNAFGYEHTITQGIISELHRDVRLSDTQAYRDLIQTDASINPGNSGGPLINADGDMIGLNVAIRAGAQGIGFAIPVNDVMRVLSELLSREPIATVYHGLSVQKVPTGTDASSHRIIVKAVVADSPAAKSGVQAGDELIVAAGRDIQQVHDVARAAIGRKPEEMFTVRVRRGDQEKELTLQLRSIKDRAVEPSELIWQRLGLRLTEQVDGDVVRAISGQLRGGLRIAEISTQSPAARAGLSNGDILVGLHHWETLSVENVAYVLKQRDLNPVRFFVVRSGQIHRGWLNLPRE